MATERLQSISRNVVRTGTLTLEKSLPGSTYSGIFGFCFWIATDRLYISRCFLFSRKVNGPRLPKGEEKFAEFQLKRDEEMHVPHLRTGTLTPFVLWQYSDYMAFLASQEIYPLSCRPPTVNLLNTTKTFIEETAEGFGEFWMWRFCDS